MIRLALRCRRTEAEAALAELLELAPGGVEEVDEPDGHQDMVEYAIYGAAGELPDLGTLRVAAGGALMELRSERVPDDWSERWKRFYHPLLIAGQLYVRPPWERQAERGRVVEVVIDPGRAFGTGTHPTTSMCLELLLKTRPNRSKAFGLLGRRNRRSLCDLGCGSGVLAIAAAKLGFEPVLGIDVDPVAIEESARNARLNYVELELRRTDVRQGLVPAADVVTANLTPALLEEVASRWAASGTRPGRLIASGFLREEAGRVRDSLARTRLRTTTTLTGADWAAVLAEPS